MVVECETYAPYVDLPFLLIDSTCEFLGHDESYLIVVGDAFDLYWCHEIGDLLFVVVMWNITAFQLPALFIGMMFEEIELLKQFNKSYHKISTTAFNAQIVNDEGQY